MDVFSGERLGGYRTNPALMNGLVDVNGEAAYDAFEGSKCDKLELGNDPNFLRNPLADGSCSSQTLIKQGHGVLDSPVMRPQPINDQSHDCRRPVSCTCAGHHCSPLCCPPNTYYRHNFCPADPGCTNHRPCERTYHQNCDPPNAGYTHTNCGSRHPVYHQPCAQVDQRHHGNCAQVDQRHHGNCGQTNQGCQVGRGFNHDCYPPQRHATPICFRHQRDGPHHVGHHVQQHIAVEGKLHLMPCPENAPMNPRSPVPVTVQTISSQHNTQQIQLSGGYCSTLLPVGKIIQIWGPPMAGKSTYIDQKITESRKIHKNIIHYSFNCKNLPSLHDVLMKVCKALNPGVHACQCEPNSILGLIISVLQAHPSSHHVLVFHKCESLRSRGYDNEFMTYLSEVSAASQSNHLKATIYFTTYKRFPVSGRAIDLVQVGMLTDFDKIIAMLKKYAPGVYVNDYAYICQRYLCLPEAVVRLAQEYLSQEECMPSAGLLEHIAVNDINFLALIFEKRVGEVSDWVQREDFELISCFGHCLLSTTRQEHIEAVYRALHPDHNRARWPLCLKRLLDDNILRRLPEIDRLAVHPLIVYCCKVMQPGGLMLFRDPMVNSYCTFMCHVLARAELNITLHGRKGEVFGCLLNEWPHVRHLLEMAAHCQAGTYPAFLRVAVVARRLLVCCFPNEAKQFYSALYQSSQVLGTPSQRAVLQACLGHSMANSAVVDWESAEHHLQSAVTELKTHGPVFFYKWALTRLAILAQRTGDSKGSLEYFSKVKAVRGQEAFVTDKLLEVSQLQIQEAEVSAEVNGATPMIFSGNITGARQQLMRLLEDPEIRIERIERHPEFPVLLNSLGLIEERATGNIRGALVWYIRSYRERLYLEKIIPHYVMVSLNNIAMVLYRLGQFTTCNQYLMKAIEIQRRRGWTHHDTALTLIHLGEIKVKQGEFMAAFKYNQEAETILSQSVKYNDSRPRVNMALVHLKVVLKQDAGLLAGADPDDYNAVFGTTVADHIEAMVAISRRVSDHLSVDGHHYIMLTYEHGVRINCRRDPVKTREHMKALLKHVQENAYVRDVINSRDEAASSDDLIAKHRGFYFYIQSTPYECLDLKILTELLYESCGHCTALTVSRDHDIWEAEIEERQQTKVKEQLTQNTVSSQSGSDQTVKKGLSFAENEGVTEGGHVDKPQMHPPHVSEAMEFKVSLIKGDPIMQPDQTINKASPTIDQPSLSEVRRTVPRKILHNPVNRFEMGTPKALELFVKEQDVMEPSEAADVQSRSVGDSCAPGGMVTAMRAGRSPKELELFLRQEHVLEPVEASGVRYSSRDSPLLGRMGTAKFSVHPESEASSQREESFKDSANSRDGENCEQGSQY